MAKTKTVEYTLSLDDLASSVYQKFVGAVESGEVDISKAIKGASGAFDQHGQSIRTVTGWIKEQRAESREHSFVINQGRDAVAAAGLAMNIWSGTLGAGNAKLKDTVNVVNTGVVAFQGLNAVTSMLPGPWSLAISVAGGLTASLFAMGNETEKSTAVVRSHQQAIDALLTSYDAWQEKFKGVTDSSGNFTKAQIEVTKQNAAVLQTQINRYREYLDVLDKGRSVQENTLGGVAKYREAIQTTAQLQKLNTEYLQESQTFQKAYNNALAEGKSKEEAKTAALKAANEELQGLIDKQDGYIASLASMTATGTQASGSLAAMRVELASLKQQFDAAGNDDSRTKIRKQIDALTVSIHEMEAPPKSDFVFTFGYQMEKSFQAGHAAVQQMQDSMTALFGTASQKPKEDAGFTIETKILGVENLYKTEGEIIDSWEKTMTAMVEIQQAATEQGSAEWQRYEDMKTRITATANRGRLKLDRDAALQGAQLAAQAVNLIGRYSAQGTSARVIDIETQRDAALASIDEQLAAENLSEEQRKQLLAQRDQLQKQYDAEERKAKQEGFEAQKTASIIEAIINTAVAVTKALEQGGFILGIPMAAVVAAMGAAEIGLIAGQPTPKFHEGTPGPVYFDAPPSTNIPIMVRGGETFQVRTERQQESTVTNISFQFFGPVAGEEAFIKMIQGAVRKAGLSNPSELFANRRSRVTLGPP